MYGIFRVILEPKDDRQLDAVTRSLFFKMGEVRGGGTPESVKLTPITGFSESTLLSQFPWGLNKRPGPEGPGQIPNAQVFII